MAYQQPYSRTAVIHVQILQPAKLSTWKRWKCNWHGKLRCTV